MQVEDTVDMAEDGEKVSSVSTINLVDSTNDKIHLYNDSKSANDVFNITETSPITDENKILKPDLISLNNSTTTQEKEQVEMILAMATGNNKQDDLEWDEEKERIRVSSSKFDRNY